MGTRGSQLLVCPIRSSASPHPLVPQPLWSLPAPLPPTSSSGPLPAPLIPPAKGLTRRSDRGAGVGVLGAAVGALLVAVVLVGRNAFVAFQRFTWVKTGRRRSESSSAAPPWSPEGRLHSVGFHGHW